MRYKRLDSSRALLGRDWHVFWWGRTPQRRRKQSDRSYGGTVQWRVRGTKREWRHLRLALLQRNRPRTELRHLRPTLTVLELSGWRSRGGGPGAERLTHKSYLRLKAASPGQGRVKDPQFAGKSA